MSKSIENSLARRCSTTELHPHKWAQIIARALTSARFFAGTVDKTRQSRRLAQTPLQWSFQASVNESRWEGFKVTQRDPSTDARDDDDFPGRVPTACQPGQFDSRRCRDRWRCRNASRRVPKNWARWMVVSFRIGRAQRGIGTLFTYRDRSSINR